MKNPFSKKIIIIIINSSTERFSATMCGVSQFPFLGHTFSVQRQQSLPQFPFFQPSVLFIFYFCFFKIASQVFYLSTLIFKEN